MTGGKKKKTFWIDILLHQFIYPFVHINWICGSLLSLKLWCQIYFFARN